MVSLSLLPPLTARPVVAFVAFVAFVLVANCSAASSTDQHLPTGFPNLHGMLTDGDKMALTHDRQLRRSKRLEAQKRQQQQQPVASRRQPSLITQPEPTQLELPRLTRKNLALFDQMTGNGATPSRSKPKSRTNSTTASSFAAQAARNGILDRHDSKPPNNISTIRKRYTASRATNSPTESEFEDYIQATARAPNEATVAGNFQDALVKKYGRGYQRYLNQAFTGFPSEVGFNNGLSAAQPDFVQGLDRGQYQPVDVDEINGAVLYADNPKSVTLPHIAGEFKRLGGDLRVAEVQARYDGATLTYARNQALTMMNADTPGDAHVTTFATDGRFLDTYAHYADSEGRYHQHRVASADLESHKGFKDGYRMLRNAQDRAREASHKLRDQLQAHHGNKQDIYMPAERGHSTALAAAAIQAPLSAVWLWLALFLASVGISYYVFR
jgi:hypothetical protein